MKWDTLERSHRALPTRQETMMTSWHGERTHFIHPWPMTTAQRRRQPTRVIHVDELSHYDDAIYVGRAMPRRRLPKSPFANPFKIGRDGTRQQVIDRYADYLAHSPDLLAQLPRLRGCHLACWCRHDQQEKTDETYCHADILVFYLDRFTDDELREIANADESQPGATHMIAIAVLDEAMDEEDRWALEAANQALGTASVADERDEVF